MTATATGSPFWLLIGGSWKQLEGVTPSVSVAVDRASSSFISLGGTRYVQSSARAARTWGFGYTWETVEGDLYLRDAASNPADAVYLLDRSIAQQQMLAPSKTKGTSTVTLAVNGRTMKTFKAAETSSVRVRGGVSYSLSFSTSHTAGATIGTYNLGAGTVNIVAPAGTGTRRGSIAFMPGTDATVTIIWTVADKTTAARLTEGSVDTIGFVESTGGTPCRVSVSDGQSTVRMFWTDRLALADTTYTVSEVG